MRCLRDAISYAEPITRGRVSRRHCRIRQTTGVTNANVSVFARLICETASPFVERNTDATGVPLEPNGDFRIDDILSPAPNGCASPALLIRSAGNRTWFAAGIQKLED